jgi:dTDP-4-dehydrorhamnose 3,5-epimerase-like enzyme
MVAVSTINGSAFSDDRGKMKFFNTFNMKEILRFYEISPADTNVIRAWQGHWKEKKWFYCTAGSFIINLVKINTTSPIAANTDLERFELNENTPLVLEVDGGHASGFKATQNNSKLLVFSNFTLEQSKQDDIRFPVEQWHAIW